MFCLSIVLYEFIVFMIKLSLELDKLLLYVYWFYEKGLSLYFYFFVIVDSFFVKWVNVNFGNIDNNFLSVYSNLSFWGFFCFN